MSETKNLSMNELESVTGGVSLTPDQMWNMLTERQKQQLKACQTPGDVKKVAMQYGLYLTDEQAKQVYEYVQTKK